MLNQRNHQSRREKTSWLTTWTARTTLPFGWGSIWTPRSTSASLTDSCSSRPSLTAGGGDAGVASGASSACAILPGTTAATSAAKTYRRRGDRRSSLLINARAGHVTPVAGRRGGTSNTLLEDDGPPEV